MLGTFSGKCQEGVLLAQKATALSILPSPSLVDNCKKNIFINVSKRENIVLKKSKCQKRHLKEEVVGRRPLQDVFFTAIKIGNFVHRWRAK